MYLCRPFTTPKSVRYFSLLVLGKCRLGLLIFKITVRRNQLFMNLETKQQQSEIPNTSCELSQSRIHISLSEPNYIIFVMVVACNYPLQFSVLWISHFQQIKCFVRRPKKPNLLMLYSKFLPSFSYLMKAFNYKIIKIIK